MPRSDQPSRLKGSADHSAVGARARRRAPRWLRVRPGPQPEGQDSGRGACPTHTQSSRRVGATTSSIASPVTNPSTASEIPPHQIPALVAELASEQATLSALQGVLTARLLASQDNATSVQSADHLLTAEQVATILGVTKRWVERRARRFPVHPAPLGTCRAVFGIGSEAVDGEPADANRVRFLRRRLLSDPQPGRLSKRAPFD